MGHDEMDFDRGRSSDDIAGTLETLIRAACLVVAFGVFLLATYYAISVFVEVGKVVKDPTLASKSVASIAQIIDADKINVPARDNKTVPTGKSIAYGLMLCGYVLWMWVPLVLLKISGHVILKSMPAWRSRQDTRRSSDV